MASPTSPGDDGHSIANSSTSPSSLPAWHFPFGPSSKYHQRERRQKPARQHSRNNSSYTPRAPALATERRSHHRRAFTGVPSPPLSSSDHSASPLGRFGKSITSMAQHELPTTPAKTRRNSPLFHDSPFSDYFTDPDALSLHEHNTPSTATQRLLVRMNKLQSHLIRTSTSPDSQTAHSTDDAIAIVGRHLTLLEHDLSTLSTHYRYTSELSDSGLFMHGTSTVATEDFPPIPSSSSSTSSGSVDDPAITITHLRAERDYFISESQQLLAGLRSAQTQLRLRHDELKELHEQQDQRVGKVEAENAGLRADLAADAGELLFLKVTSQELEARLGEKNTRKALGGELEKWWVDWSEVDERFRRRGGKDARVNAEGEDRAKWGLETTKTVDGKVTSVTIKRMEPDAEVEEVMVNDMEKLYIDQAVQTEEVQPPLEPEIEHRDENVECEKPISSVVEETESEKQANDEAGKPSENEVTQVKRSKPKTAWSELWEGLSSLAGMDESHF